jgi:hypothetical protein
LIAVTAAFAEALGSAYLAQAFVGIDNLSTRTAVVSVVLPKKNEYDVNVAVVNRRHNGGGYSQPRFSGGSR